MNVNQELAIRATDIAEGKFRLGLSASVGVCEEVIAHGGGRIAICVDAIAFPADIGPALDREPGILSAFEADEVSECFVKGLTELIVRSQCWLEHDVG